jgi:Holliday junction resolvasome RuvABC endonuclease subunit
MVSLVLKHWPPSDIRAVGIEGYSFQSKNSEADTMLKELGGCVRLHLWQQFKVLPVEIPPKSIKKLFLASGSSGKKEMIKNAEQYFGLPNLFELTGTSATIQNLHPIEDLVDAFAVATATIQLSLR